MKKLIAIASLAFLGFGCSSTGVFQKHPPWDCVPIEKIHKYWFGIADLDTSKTVTPKDRFFLGFDTNDDLKSDIVYMHRIRDYVSVSEGKYRRATFKIKEISEEVWYDYGFDGTFDYVVRKKQDNSRHITQLIGELNGD